MEDCISFWWETGWILNFSLSWHVGKDLAVPATPSCCFCGLKEVWKAWHTHSLLQSRTRTEDHCPGSTTEVLLQSCKFILPVLLTVSVYQAFPCSCISPLPHHSLLPASGSGGSWHWYKEVEAYLRAWVREAEETHFALLLKYCNIISETRFCCF